MTEPNNAQGHDSLLHKPHLFVQDQMTVGDKKVFGSGTKLYVTDEQVKAPTVFGYLPLKKPSQDKSTMLCLAKDMFPDLVKFTWTKKSNTGDWTPVENENIIEQDDTPGRKTVTSMLIANTAENYQYRCTVNHDGGLTKTTHPVDMIREKTEKKDTPKDEQSTPSTCPPPTEENTENKQQISGVSEQIPSVHLFVYAYGVMIMKNGLYLFVVCIVLLKRKAGKKEERS